MKLEPPFLIAESKLLNYLLTPLPKDDKSNYLRLAGYKIDNWSILKEDLIKLVQTEDATYEVETAFGITYSVTGELIGPNGRRLKVKTIWLLENKTGLTKFITLYPP